MTKNNEKEGKTKSSWVAKRQKTEQNRKGAITHVVQLYCRLSSLRPYPTQVGQRSQAQRLLRRVRRLSLNANFLTLVLLRQERHHGEINQHSNG